ncbi:hypothetical protein CRG95_05195 [Escherichia sp. E4208]|nr:hypothetical protein CRT22_18655 [Escherichia sp. E5028]TGB86920.1 hypothetical protein CRG95_05195 [Escherichia sp. E4208]
MLQSSADKPCSLRGKIHRWLNYVRKITKMMNGKLIYSWCELLAGWLLYVIIS